VIDGRQVQQGLYRVSDFIEKPAPDKAPSNLVVAGRYVFMPEIFDHLARTEEGAGGEIQLTDAMRIMVREHEMYGLILNGHRCDIGSREGFIKTNIEFALKHPDMAEELQTYIKDLAGKISDN
jgi:UTP--glucose-1-phosphate uridylyltransferase